MIEAYWLLVRCQHIELRSWIRHCFGICSADELCRCHPLSLHREAEGVRLYSWFKIAVNFAGGYNTTTTMDFGEKEGFQSTVLLNSELY